MSLVSDILNAAADRLDQPPPPTWRDTARADQLPATPPARITYWRGGRGSGKSWAASNVFAEWLKAAEPGSEWAVVAPTFGDGRDKCVESSESGLLAALGLPITYPAWNRSMGQLTMPNGARVYVTGADEGAKRIQGLNLSGAWCDEVGLWLKWEMAWDESIRWAVRKADARILATGTPKAGQPARKLVRRLLDDSRVDNRRLLTLDNVDNLAPDLVEDARAMLGTRLGAQELEGQLLDDIDGALWSTSELREHRLPPFDPDRRQELRQVVVGVDPSFGGGDEAGIVVVGLSADRQGRVLADYSIQGTPDEWAPRVVEAFDTWDADVVVCEMNMTAKVVQNALTAARANLPVKPVRVNQGKLIRAEPVAVLYAGGRVAHCGEFLQLEAQMTEFTGTGKSPDRLDALVHALSYLLLDHPRRPAAAVSAARVALPRGAAALGRKF